MKQEQEARGSVMYERSAVASSLVIAPDSLSFGDRLRAGLEALAIEEGVRFFPDSSLQGVPSERSQVSDHKRASGSDLSVASLSVEAKAFKLFFEAAGYRSTVPAWIANPTFTTVLVGAAVQALEPVIHGGAAIACAKNIVGQPVIRSQYRDSISAGSLSSFINLALLRVDPDLEQHLSSVRAWLTFLDFKHISRERISIAERPAESVTWGTKSFVSYGQFVVVDGVEIGDFNLLTNIPQKNRPPITISDCGFGLERILWLSSGLEFTQMIRELSQLTSWNEIPLIGMDRLRGAVLLAGSNVEPSNKSAGYRLRQYSRDLVTLGLAYHPSFGEMVSQVHDMWGNWTTLTLSPDSTVALLKRENQRNLHSIVLDSVDVPTTIRSQLNLALSTKDFRKRLGKSALPIGTLQEIDYRLDKLRGMQ